MRVPFNVPYISPRAGKEIERTLYSGRIGASLEGNARACAQEIERLVSAHQVILTSSCAAALDASALILRQLTERDGRRRTEIILPSFTHPATANAFLKAGFVLRFAEIGGNGNIDCSHAESLITARTAAIVTMHYGGWSSDIDTLQQICLNAGAQLIEDNAHGFLGEYRNQHLGTFGMTGCVSFHETKNITCGEGGALYVNNPDLVDIATMTVDHGTDRQHFIEKRVANYSWNSPGGNYRLPELAVSLLLTQLSEIEEIQSARSQRWQWYFDSLLRWASEQEIRIVDPRDHTRKSNFHIFFLRMPASEARVDLQKHLLARGIEATSHFQPLHLSVCGRSMGYQAGSLPFTEEFAESILRLPLYSGLSQENQARVIDALRAWRRA